MASWRFEAIGTHWEIETTDRLPEEARTAVAVEIERFDREWSRFRADSGVARLGSQGGTLASVDAGASSSSSSGGDSTATYADGTYTAEGSYQTPETVEKISVTLTLADGVVTDVEVSGDPQAPESKQYQAATQKSVPGGRHRSRKLSHG